MTIEPVGPVGLTVPPPEPQSDSETVAVVEQGPPPESAPLPPYQGSTVDETA
jgi:hypothetical protein